MATLKAVSYRLLLLFLTGSLLMTLNFDLDSNWMRKVDSKAIPKSNACRHDKGSKTCCNEHVLHFCDKDTSVNSRRTSVIRHFIKHVKPAIHRQYRNQTINNTETTISKGRAQRSRNFRKKTTRKKQSYRIHWYNPPQFLKVRKKAYRTTFSGCEYSNCKMTYDRKWAKRSDAVIFDGRWVPPKLEFKRPAGQLWIFAAHESPHTYNDRGNWWTRPQWVSSFNWTMTYNKDIADIYLPYGEIRPTTRQHNRNFTEVALRKTKTALAIISHCSTRSNREGFIKHLERFIDIDVLGACGKEWSCGKRYIHDGCFQILNTTYKFFLSFENAMCDHYFTEKLFENYNYDIILVVRGGRTKDSAKHLVNGTYVPTDEFKSIPDLGLYLRRLAWSLDDYADLLREKSKYKAEGFETVYKRAMCDICKRVNNKRLYKKRIVNIKDFIYGNGNCRRSANF